MKLFVILVSVVIIAAYVVLLLVVGPWLDQNIDKEIAKRPPSSIDLLCRIMENWLLDKQLMKNLGKVIKNHQEREEM